MTYFLDFEASSLTPDSFPIEIAWVDQNGQGESYLIRPSVEWIARPSGWSDVSERVHGISMEMLMDQGVPIEQVGRRAGAVLGSLQALVCSDAPPSDGHWLRTLLDAANVRRKVSVFDVRTVYGWACGPLLNAPSLGGGSGGELANERVRQVAMEIITTAENAEGLRPRVQHRALPDAESLWRTWRAIKDQVSHHPAVEQPR